MCVTWVPEKVHVHSRTILRSISGTSCSEGELRLRLSNNIPLLSQISCPCLRRCAVVTFATFFPFITAMCFIFLILQVGIHQQVLHFNLRCLGARGLSAGFFSLSLCVWLCIHQGLNTKQNIPCTSSWLSLNQVHDLYHTSPTIHTICTHKGGLPPFITTPSCKSGA